MKPIKTLVLIVAVGCAFNFASAQTWTQTSAPATNWTSIASSADGTKLVATVFGYPDAAANAIYNSTDSGLTWALMTTAPNQRWYSIACSADGSKLTAIVYNSPGGIYTSTNSGADWTAASVPSANWTSVAYSADGKKLAAVAYGGGIYASTNFGTTWTQTSAPVTNWYSIASSADGGKLVAAVYANDAVSLGGQIYVSTNSGTTWTVTSAPVEYWQSVASSTDGARLVASTRFDVVFNSIDAGASWVSNSLPSQTGVTERSIALSADGMKLVAITSGGQIYTSTNLGTSWVSNSVPSLGWWSVASSADGNKLAVVAFNFSPGPIYTSQATPSPLLNITPTNGSFDLSWIIPSTNFVLQQSSNLTSWADVTNVPTLNFTNLQNEVMLSPTGGSGFYRLKTL